MSKSMNLYNDNCFTTLEQLVSDNIKVNAVICDPPYNIEYEYWDKNFDLFRAILLCKELLKDNGNLILFQGYSNVIETKQFLDQHFNFKNWIIWDRLKGRGGTKNLVSTREDILWYCKGEDCTFNKLYSNNLKVTRGKGMGGKNGQQFRALTNVWYDISPIVPWSEEHTEHPTQKPLELMERCVSLWTNESDTVLDFTMGSGTTGVACKKLKRNFIGIEIDQEWFKIAEDRINSIRSTKKLFNK